MTSNGHLELIVIEGLSPLSACGTWDYRWIALRGGVSKGSYPVFTRVLEKTTENSEQLVRQARPGLEPGTSRNI